MAASDDPELVADGVEQWCHRSLVERHPSGMAMERHKSASISEAILDRFECKVIHEYEAFVNCTETGVQMGLQKLRATSETEYRSCIFANCGTRSGA